MDEQELVRGLKARQPAAVAEMASLYGDRLLRSAFLLCGNATEAEDLVQETFLQAIRSVDRYRGAAKVYTWLYSILLNLTRHQRRERKWLVFTDALPAPERPDVPSMAETSADTDIQLTSAAVTDVLLRLSSPHREVLVLRYYEDLKLNEIAERVGVSIGTVKSRLHYAIREMQGLLPREMNPFAEIGTKEIETR